MDKRTQRGPGLSHFYQFGEDPRGHQLAALAGFPRGKCVLAHYPMVAADRRDYNDFTEAMCVGFSIPWLF